MPHGVAEPIAAVAPLPPQNLDAEESVLGAMLLAPTAIDAVAQVIDAGDFYRQSHARIYRAALTLHRLGLPVDAITIADRLAESQELDEVGGNQRIHELAALVPATGNAAHYARIVRDMATLRGLTTVGERIQRLGWERPENTATLVQQARGYVDELAAQRVGAGMPLDGGLTHQEVLDLDFPQERYLIDDLIPAGAVGTIAAVPESHKSWLAQAIAVRVGRGAGWVLGKPVTRRARVGYIWQDDSTSEEAQRIDAFEQVHPTSPDGSTDVIWWLNLGVELPRDIQRLRATVEQHKLALLVLDSYYNFLPGIDLKDEAAEQIISLLKREISDATGCTVLIVDHMPWATDANRQRLRAYGGVFKNAAIRFGIYIDAAGDKLHLEARGNNIAGIPRTLAYWDPDQLELRLIRGEDADDEDLKAPAQQIIDWLAEHGDNGAATTAEICFALEISDKTLRAREGRLEELGVEAKRTRGKPTIYRIRRLDELHEQLAVPDQNLSEPTNPQPPSGYDLGTPRKTSEVPTSEVKPSDRAKTASPRNTPEVNATSGDMQGFSTSEVATPLKGGHAGVREDATPASNGSHPDADLDALFGGADQ